MSLVMSARRHGRLFLLFFSLAHAFQVPLGDMRLTHALHASLRDDVNLAKHSLLRIAAAILSVPSDVWTTPPMLEPRPTHSSRHRKAVSELLDKGWNTTTTNGFNVSRANELLDAYEPPPNTTDPSTYGEVTELGARQLFYYMKMEQQDNAVFYDLGSGVGKLVVQAYAEVPSLKRAVGVELDPARHVAAVEAWTTIQESARNVRGMDCQEASLALERGDLFQVNVTDATHIYVASLCFTDEMMERLADKLASEAVNLKCVASLKEFPSRFVKPKVEYVEMSWTRLFGEGCAVYFYTRTS